MRIRTQIRIVHGDASRKDTSAVLEECGQSLSEYGLILLLVVGVAVIVLTLFGNQLLALLNQIVNAF